MIPRTAIDEALAILPPYMGTTRSRVLLLAIGFQESEFLHRRQIGGGPARGYWQFERGGGVVGVLTHAASKGPALEVCRLRDVGPDASSAWAALAEDDVLAAAFARLLIWTDPKPLPAVEDAPGAWAYYLRNWRPGQPRPDEWAGNHVRAREALW